MEEKVVKTRVVKHVFKVREITHILEIVQQKARNAINAPKKVSLKDAADQRYGLRVKKINESSDYFSSHFRVQFRQFF